MAPAASVRRILLAAAVACQPHRSPGFATEPLHVHLELSAAAAAAQAADVLTLYVSYPFEACMQQLASCMYQLTQSATLESSETAVMHLQDWHGMA